MIYHQPSVFMAGLLFIKWTSFTSQIARGLLSHFFFRNKKRQLAIFHIAQLLFNGQGTHLKILAGGYSTTSHTAEENKFDLAFYSRVFEYQGIEIPASFSPGFTYLKQTKKWLVYRGFNLCLFCRYCFYDILLFHLSRSWGKKREAFSTLCPPDIICMKIQDWNYVDIQRNKYLQHW